MELKLRERDRLSVVRQVDEGVLSVAVGVARLGVTPRHLRRLRRRFEAEGDGVVVHGLRGRASNRALPPALRERVLEIASGPLYRGFGPTLLAEHLGVRFGLRVSADTVRRWMQEAGLWERRRKRARHRRRRECRAVLGSSASGYLRQHGRPLAFYADHAGHFGQWRTAKGKRTDTIIARGLDQLGVEMILASSPQAKGRVERSFGTAQDRLVKEMRVEGIAGLAEANRFLAERWVPFWNERFAVEPAVSGDAHRPLPREVDLEAVFADTEGRVVANDLRSGSGTSTGTRRWSWNVVSTATCASGSGSGKRYLEVELLGRERPRAQATATKPRPLDGSPACRSRARTTRGASASTKTHNARSRGGNAASLGRAHGRKDGHDHTTKGNSGRGGRGPDRWPGRR